MNAGHPAGYLLRTGAVPVALESGGRPLGLLPGATYVTANLELRPGDIGVLVTDGITEALETGPMTLSQILGAPQQRPTAGRSPAEVCDDLLRAAAAGAGPAGVSDWQDDRTVFVFARRGECLNRRALLGLRGRHPRFRMHEPAADAGTGHPRHPLRSGRQSRHRTHRGPPGAGRGCRRRPPAAAVRHGRRRLAQRRSRPVPAPRALGLPGGRLQRATLPGAPGLRGHDACARRRGLRPPDRLRETGARASRRHNDRTGRLLARLGPGRGGGRAIRAPARSSAACWRSRWTTKRNTRRCDPTTC